MEKGYFGKFGGSFVPAPVQKKLDELEKSFYEIKDNPDFHGEYLSLLKEFVGRPSPLTYASNLSESLGGAKIYLKREDLNHLGSHKINNTVGQILLAKYMGKKRIIAETGAGQHGVATAAVAAKMGIACTVYMGEVDVHRQELNVMRMRMMGAEVIPVSFGQGTLKEAVDAALEAYVESEDDCFYLLGSVVGPHPYPSVVRHFQSIIGKEARKQFIEREGKLPDALVACVGGGSNAIGLFAEFLDQGDDSVQIFGVEPSGRGLEKNGYHAATITKGQEGILHGFKTMVIMNDQNEVSDVYSISAGLDYPGVGPEHAHLHDIKRVDYKTASDDEAIHALKTLCQKEGIVPALESSHGLAYAMELAKELGPDKSIIVSLSGRGDKDMRALFEREK